MKPLVSILIPAHNAAKYIAQTIRSALCQTWPHKEVIVVDDGSRDRTIDVVRQFGDAVLLISQTNSGASAARNRALSHAKGDYIQYLDADDLLAPDKIERQLAEARGPLTLLSGAWGQFLYRHRITQFKASPLWADLHPAEWLRLKMAGNFHMQTATWLVSRELSEIEWDERLSLDDDGEYFCRVLKKCEGIRFVPDSKVYYRATPNSLSYVGLSNKKLESQWLSMNVHISTLLSMEDSPRVHSACVQYLQTWLPFFYPDRMDIVQEMKQVAEEFDGQLKIPTLSWKYRWLEQLFGYSAGKRASIVLPKLKHSVRRTFDRAMFVMESVNRPK